MGWQAYAMAEDPDSYAGNYEFQVPIFVLTHNVPSKRPKQTNTLTFTFVTDGIASAIRQAMAAAGAKDVTVIGGARSVQQCLCEKAIWQGLRPKLPMRSKSIKTGKL
jgi:dihydrofolate reductase